MDEPAVTCNGPVHVSLSIAGYMAEDILDGLTLKLDGSDVHLTRSTGPGGRLQLTGRGPSLSGRKLVRFELAVPRTITPEGGNRTLAVMFSKLEIEPIDAKVVQ